MGTMTLSDFRTEVTAGLQRGGLSNTDLDRWINRAIMEFAYAFPFKELEAIKTFVTAADDNTYSINAAPISLTDFRAMHEFGLVKTDPDERRGKLIPESRVRYLKNIGDIADTTTHGNPTHYHKFGNVIYLRPVPDSVLITIDLHYHKNITKLAGVNDTTQFHEDWDEAVTLGALYRGLRHFGEFDRFQNMRADFVATVRTRALEYGLEEFPEGGISAVGPNDSEEGVLAGE